MNELTKFLVESVIGTEFDKPKTSVALFGGGFKPPTKGHLEVVNKGLENNPEISEIKILVGGGTRNGFTQDQAVKIWNLYNDVGFIKKPATIIPVSSPFTYYKNYLEDNPNDQVYVFIGSRLDDKGDQKDVKQRSEFVKKYSDNVIPVEVSTGGGVSGTMARELFKTDLDGFRNMFPENLLDQDFDKILNILNNKSTNTTQKPASNKTEPLSPLNENLILERIKITPNEASNLKLVLNQYKKILKKSTINDLDTGVITLGTMPFKSADSMPGLDSGTVEFLLDYGPYSKNKKNAAGWYNSNNTQSLDDDTITVNASTFLPAFDILPSIFNKVTGESADQMLMDTLKHELIHAKDPGRNQGYLKEPYDPKDESLYYGSWTEFPTQTGEFLEAISTHAEEKLKNNPNDEEIQIFEKVLQNILDVFAGKEKQWLPQTVNFINKGSKQNVIQQFIKNAINIGGEIANYNTVPKWDSMRTLDRYLFKLGKIKRYNPEGYREFLTNLYKEIKGIEEMTNFYLKERAKELGQTKFNQIYVGGTGKLNEGDPKKGTGKKPKGSGRRLYTDEDPKDTVGIKFSTRQDIVDTLNKKSFKAKSHARQSQIINLIHQRVRAAYGRAKDPAVKKRLKTGLDYIADKKEASKKKTQRLKNQKENIDPKSQSKHKGKSAPFGSAYEPLNENATYSSKIDYKQQIKDLTKHMIKKGMNILPLPKVIFKHGDQENASQFLGKTAYYSPSDMTVVLYTEGRHPKDIVRSFAHEMVHHIQNLEDRLENINTTNTTEDDNLNDIEREAYTKGNMTFRNWTDSLDGEEVTSLNEKIVGEKIECDNCGWSWNIVDGGDDLYICHKCNHDNEPENGDPFGLKAYARELMEDFNIEDIKPATKSLEEQKEVRIFTTNCGCDKT